MGPLIPERENLSLLGLMAKIKCSICSYQFNIWYAGHVPAHILIWFLAFGQGSEACFTLTTGCLGIALQPSAAHYLTNEMHQNSALVMVILRLSDIAILRHCDIATLRYCRLKFYLFQISKKMSSFLNFMFRKKVVTIIKLWNENPWKIDFQCKWAVWTKTGQNEKMKGIGLWICFPG